MGCVGGFNKNCDKCIYLLRQYGGVVKNNNYTTNNPKEKIILEKNSNFYKKKLNNALENMNKSAKYEHEYKQLKELNEIYQTLLTIESERNKSKIDLNNNINNNDLNDNYDDLNKII